MATGVRWRTCSTHGLLYRTFIRIRRAGMHPPARQRPCIWRHMAHGQWRSSASRARRANCTHYEHHAHAISHRTRGICTAVFLSAGGVESPGQFGFSWESLVNRHPIRAYFHPALMFYPTCDSYTISTDQQQPPSPVPPSFKGFGYCEQSKGQFQQRRSCSV